MSDQRLQGCNKWLRWLRSGTEQYTHFIAYLRRDVFAGGFSLADIGTSEEELVQLRFLGAKIAARQWLERLRSGTEQYTHFIGYLRREVLAGGFSLVDIGTSDEELVQLRFLGAKIAARQWLERLRSGTEQYTYFIGYLRGEVLAGGFSLADIDTSEEELEQLRILGAKIAARQWLERLRSDTDRYTHFIGYLRREVLAGCFSLADIGTSEEELGSLESRRV